MHERRDGTVSTWYLYDTPATNVHSPGDRGQPRDARDGGAERDLQRRTTSGCPVPDLMGIDPPPAPVVTPPLYNYSNEITGGTTPGGAVVRRDTDVQRRDGHDDRQHEGPHLGHAAAGRRR